MSQLLIHNEISKQTGFTLVELVIVIIVLGVLSAVAIPKLTGKSAFEEYVVQDQLISALRLVQLQGMNADPSVDAKKNACYWLVVKDNCFYHEHAARTGDTCKAPKVNHCGNDSYNEYSIVNFSPSMLDKENYRFDLQGHLIVNNSRINNPFNIKVDGENDLKVVIETEGYIHEP